MNTTVSTPNNGLAMGVFLVFIIVALILLSFGQMAKKKKKHSLQPMPVPMPTEKKLSKFADFPKIVEIETDPDKSYLLEKLARMLPGIEEGLTDSDISRYTKIPRGTVHGYRKKYFSDRVKVV